MAPMSDLPPPPPPSNLSPPPGYVPYGIGAAGVGNLRTTRGLAKWLVALLGISLVMQVVTLLVQFALRRSATNFIQGSISSSQFDKKLGLYLAMIALAAVAATGQLVVLIVWTFRLAKNHQVLQRQPQSFSPGATIAINILGGCTLFILNFFMWRELWRASDPDTPRGAAYKQGPVTPLLGVYLAMTICGAVASVAIGLTGTIGPIRTGSSSTDLAKNLDGKLGFVLLAGALSMAAAAVFLVFVRQLSARHIRAIGEA